MTLPLAILRSASLLVPGLQRAEWFAEWSAELWYVKQSATAFCLGAFRDAFWLRRNSATPNARPTFGLSSPFRCLAFLAFLAAVSVLFAVRLPAARDMFRPSPYPDARNLAIVSTPGQRDPRISIEQYRSIALRMRHVFTDLAFYRPTQRPVQIGPQASTDLAIAITSANLFELLQVPISSQAPGTQLVLSDAAWRKHFHADPHVVGRFLDVSGESAVIAGVIPAASWRLPGKFDAWLLQDPANLAELPPHTTGFVLGYLRAPASDSHWRISVPNDQGGDDRLQCASLAKEPILLAFLGMVVMSLLILSVTSSWALGDYSANRQSFRRWIFFTVKIVLLLPIVCCGTLDLASVVAVGFQPHGLIVGTIVALRWALNDQRQRCPVCLRLLTGPTRIGGASQTFLEWYGTELVCAQGHGLLYVPEIRTSCYSTQRWQHLDPSWSVLFPTQHK
jgi:hypothetical protein